MNDCCAEALDICRCSCHTDGSVHNIPCCGKCPHCEQNIERDRYDAHVVHCEVKHAEPKDFNNPEQLEKYLEVLKKHLD